MIRIQLPGNGPNSINNYIVHGQDGAVNPEKKGTKAAAHYRLTVNPGACQVVRLRLSATAVHVANEAGGVSIDYMKDGQLAASGLERGPQASH